jgi:hypothetical protein
MQTPALRIVYTAPNSRDVGENVAYFSFGEPPPALEAACRTELTIDHPPGEELRLASPALHAESIEEKLVVQLPDAEHPLELVCLAVPSQTAVKIFITTKKEGSKPEPPRRATFSR